MKNEFGVFADVTSQASSAAKDVSHLQDVFVAIGGTFVGTVQLDVSFDGTTFVPHAVIVGKTAPYAAAIGYPVKQARITCSAFTSGTIESGYGGKTF